MKKCLEIGWIGTGVMGHSLCGHLLLAGHSLHVFNRTPSRYVSLVERGAMAHSSIASLANSCPVIFTMVGFPEDVRQVYLSSDGLLKNSCEGAILVDMTTTSPSLSQEIAGQALKRNITALDAPVTGGDVGARNGTLSIMVGGTTDGLERVRHLLEKLGKTITHHGPSGSGQHAKLCNQIVIAGTMVGVCESLLYGTRSGLDLQTMLSAIRGGAAGCWSLENLVPRILQNNFEPGFYVDHFVKDMGLILEESRRMKLDLPGLSLAHDLYTRTQKLGYGSKGTHALFLALKEMAK